MLTFFAETSFLEPKNSLLYEKGFSFCLLRGKSKTAKAEIFKNVLQKEKGNLDGAILLCHPWVQHQPIGLYLPRREKFLVDADYFGLKKVSSVPKSRSAVLIDVDVCFKEPNSALLYSFYRAEEEKINCAKDYKSAAASMANRARNMLLPSVCKGKILNYILRFSERRVGLSRALSPRPIQYYGSVTGFSGWGAKTNFASFCPNTSTIYKIKDRLQVISPMLLKGLAAAFSSYGYEAQLFTSTLTNAPIHLYMPELKLGFFTETLQERFPFPVKDTIYTGRFLPLHTLLDCLSEIKIYTLLQEELLDECVYALLEAEEFSVAAESILEKQKDEQKFQALLSVVFAFLGI